MDDWYWRWLEPSRDLCMVWLAWSLSVIVASMHSCIHFAFISSTINVFKELKRSICKFLDMERQRRNTKEYSFRQPDLKELRNLTSYVLDPLDFKARHGKLLSILATQVDEGLMSVLVQFYDPLYRCFTFPDFQLLPTLEEYAHLLGIPVSSRMLLVDWRRFPDLILFLKLFIWRNLR